MPDHTPRGRAAPADAVAAAGLWPVGDAGLPGAAAGAVAVGVLEDALGATFTLAARGVAAFSGEGALRHDGFAGGLGGAATVERAPGALGFVHEGARGRLETRLPRQRRALVSRWGLAGSCTRCRFGGGRDLVGARGRQRGWRALQGAAPLGRAAAGLARGPFAAREQEARRRQHGRTYQGHGTPR